MVCACVYRQPKSDDGADIAGDGSELDRQDFIPQSYILEVSSGEKPIKNDEEYDRFKGRWALITTYNEIDGRKRFEGVLQGNSGDCVLIEVDGAASAASKHQQR